MIYFYDKQDKIEQTTHFKLVKQKFIQVTMYKYIHVYIKISLDLRRDRINDNNVDIPI